MKPPFGAAEVGALLPHGPEARWVEVVERLDHGAIVCRGAVPLESPFVTGGVVPAFVTVELAAQAAGLLEALERAEAGHSAGQASAAPLRGGLLVRVRRLRIDRPLLRAGERLVALVERAGASPPLRLFHVRVLDEHARPVLEGGIAVYEELPAA